MKLESGILIMGFDMDRDGFFKIIYIRMFRKNGF